MEIKEMIEVLKAFEEGKEIERQTPTGWVAITNLDYTNFNFGRSIYRIKPQPTYIPFTFKDKELFRGRWIKSKSEDSTEFSVNNISKDCAFGSVSYDKAFKEFIFIDGTPFGKLS